MDTDDVLGHARADQTTPPRSLFHSVVATDSRAGWTVVRIALAAILAWHASPIAIVLAFLLFTGTIVRPAALATIVFLFFENSMMLDILAIPLSVATIIVGAGATSVDALLMRRRPMPGGSVDDRLVNP